MKKQKYLEIYEKLKGEIIRGDYQYAGKLPSKRTIADDNMVSVITVQHAYSLLCDEGYVEARERSGYFVIYRKEDFIGDIERKEPVELSVNLEDLHSVDEISYNSIVKTMRKVMLDYGERILVKPPNAGCVELRSEIQKHLAVSRGIRVGIDQIIIGAGAEYLYSLVAQLFKKEGLIAVECPSYEKIAKVYESWGHKVDYLELGMEGILSSELKRTKAKILHVTPFHSFPSNITASISKKNEYLQWAKEGRIIIEDNYDSELTVSRKVEDALFALGEGENVIYINTFSKTIAPSIRMGYMILPKKLLERYEDKLGFYSCTAPVFEQYVIAELLRSGDYQRHINRVRRRRRQNIGTIS